MENIRYNISPCSAEEAAAFVGRIDGALYSLRGSTPANAQSHYDRYAFVRDDSKVAVVYDTSARVISITAPKDYADELLGVFGTDGRSVKRSTVPAHGGAPRKTPLAVDTTDTRARVFVTPEAIRRHPGSGTQTVIATSKGLEISTDEIFPPQRAKKRSDTFGTAKPDMRNDNASLGQERNDNASVGYARSNNGYADKPKQGSSMRYAQPQRLPSVDAYFAATDDGASIIPAAAAKKRRATISFGDEDDDTDKKKRAAQPTTPLRSGTGLYADLAAHKPQETVQQSLPQEKKRRGRPRKDTAAADIVQPLAYREFAVPSSGGATVSGTPEYKNGYSVRNFPEDKLSALIKRLKGAGYGVESDGTEFAGTSQEVRTYTVSDKAGSRVFLRYATKKMTIQLQGKRSELFGELQSQVSRDSDYSSALEGYIESNDGAKKGKVSDVENRLKRRLPTAYKYLSEQSRIDFSYGIHDFSQDMLRLSDYSVLLVPPFRGLERFIFDLQRTEGIKVKMIGQAYDKDSRGNYVLKNGYRQRIDSVVYCEVMVALYNEYFSRRNFFAHSDNSDDSRSRAISDRAVAKGIFENLLDVVEYNAKKLKEIGFRISEPKDD